MPARVVEEPQISFFTYFDQVAFDKSDAETAELLDADFAIGSLLKERVVPHALHYYDGSAMDDEDFEFDEDEDEDGEYEDEDGEDDE